MSETYDCIVLGVGGFGSGASYHLAKRGARVLGIERFGIAHDRGSSHGETRIIRKVYIEHPDYVPLVLRAYEMWDELGLECGRTLRHQFGLLLAGLPDGEAIAGSKLATRLHGVAIEEVELSEARRRFPGLRFPDDFAVAFDSDAGYLEVENCVQAHIERALDRGAVLQTGETVLDWNARGNTVQVRTDKGQYEAARMIVTAGAWSGTILADLSIPLSVVRKPVFWHEVTTRDYDASSGAPAVYFEWPDHTIYAFPCLDGKTIKVSEHTGGQPVSDPLALDRESHPADVQPVSDFLHRCLPGVRPQPSRHNMCMYTLTPDQNFIIDRHPQHQNVVIGAGFSGHGFKFTTVLGEALADLCLDGQTKHPIEFLSIGRESLR